MATRLLSTSVPSPAAIEQLYRRDPRLATRPYRVQRDAILFESLNGYADAYALNFPPYGYEVQTLLPNVVPLQLQWARENGLAGLARRYVLASSAPVATTLNLAKMGCVSRVFKSHFLDTVFMAQVRAYDPDILWILLPTNLTPASIRRARAHARVVIAQLDAPFPAYRELVDCYDLIFTSYPQFATCFAESGLSSLEMPLAFEPTFMARCAQKHPGPAPRTHKAVFVGSLSHHHKERMRLMAALAETGLVEFWVSLDDIPRQAVPEAIRRASHPPVYGLDMYDVYRRAKIALNVHAEVSGPYAGIFRMFEITGAGAMLLTDDRPNMSDFFEPGVEAVTFTSANDCVDKLTHYLENEEARAGIARRGQERTLAEHCFEHRVPRIIELVQPLLDVSSNEHLAHSQPHTAVR